MYGTDSMSRRPRKTSKSSAQATADLSSLLGGSTTVISANAYTEGWFAGFKRRVDSAYVTLNKRDQREMRNVWDRPNYTSEDCFSAMLDAEPEQRERALMFLEAHPSRNAYSAMMRSFIATQRDSRSPAFDNFLALYDTLVPYMGDKNGKLIGNLVDSFSFKLSSMGKEAHDSLLAVLKVTAFCANTQKGKPYVTDEPQAESFYMHDFSGHINRQRLEGHLQFVVATNPDLADRVIAVISNSDVLLSSQEVASIAASNMSSSLMDGLL